MPGWAQGVVAALARDQPRVVTRTDVDALLHELGVVRGTDDAIAELRRLGWLVHLGIAGTWTFIPPGQAEVVDPYLGLRAWDRIASPGFHLSGANAAWFLGYLDRASDGKAQILLRAETLLPKGLRASVSTLRCQHSDCLGRPARTPSNQHSGTSCGAGSTSSAGPTVFPASGPEALLAQLALRPASFKPWDDLIAHLPRLVEDTDDDRLTQLLEGSSAAAWQRSAYLLHAGGSPQRGIALFDAAPLDRWPVTVFAVGETTNDDGLWVPQYELVDRLVHPTQAQLGKA